MHPIAPLDHQTPIFIALYQTLREIQKFVPDTSNMFKAMCSPVTKANLCKAPTLDFFGMNLALSAKDAHGADAFRWYYLASQQPWATSFMLTPLRHFGERP